MPARLNNILAATVLSAIGIVPISVTGLVVSGQPAFAQTAQQLTISTTQRKSDFSVAIARFLQDLGVENPFGRGQNLSPADSANSDDTPRPENTLIDPSIAAPPMAMSLTDLQTPIDATQNNNELMYLSFNRDEPPEVDQNPPDEPLTLSEPEATPVTDSAISEASLDF